jgi:glucan phosphoethanolaminetransferase (alkaline phosphatase superfamily)
VEPGVVKVFASPQSGSARRAFRPTTLAVSFVVAWLTLCGLILFVLWQRTPTTISFEIAVREANPKGSGFLPCFYYDTGSGFSDRQKSCFSYNRQPLNQFHTYQIVLPARQTIRQLRFDPLAEPGVVALRDLVIGRYRFSRVDIGRELGHSLFALRQSQLSLEGDTLVARLATDDPQLILSNNIARLTGFDAGIIVHAVTLALVICLCAAALIGCVRVTMAPAWRPWLRRYAVTLVASWVILVGLVLLVQRLRTPTVVSFEIAVREGGEGLLPCFFYDTGSGFSEAEKTCFSYNRGPIEDFQFYRVVLPTSRTIRKLRFDPFEAPGAVALRHVTIARYRAVKINLGKEFGHTLYPLHASVLTLDGDVLVARLSTTDPYFMLSDRVYSITAIDWRVVSRAAKVALVIWLSLIAILVLLGMTRIPDLVRGWLDFMGQHAQVFVEIAQAAMLSALAAFLVSMIGAKIFALGTSAIHYRRAISLADLATAPAEDIAIGLLALVVVWIAFWADTLCAKQRWTLPLRVPLVGFQVIVTLILVGLALFEILCCYVFWEWGAFVDGSLIMMAYESPTPDSVHYYLTRAPAAIAALAAVALGCFGIYAFRRFRREAIPRRLVVALASVAAIWSLGALSPLRAPDDYDPSVSSPIVLAMSTDPGEASKGLDPKVVAPDMRSFNLPASRPVPAAYQRYHGAAAGQDVIFVVLESVRRANVSLYGYGRDTTPNLRRISDHSMVFSNVYVSQPRSSKTMESFTLGIYSDPRKKALSWDPDRIAGRPTFWGKLAHDGYGVYLGVNANRDSDGFAPFMKAALGPALERSVGLSDLVARYGDTARPLGTQGNDSVLVDDFLQWYRQRKGAAAAVIWFAGAHHPYWATTKKFPEQTPVDQYDNCIYSSDAAVGHLIDGIEKTGRHPLVLIFGDHGEAFGEHTGDQFHGVYLYNQSMRIPMVLYSPMLFPKRQDFDGRFTIKDVPATLLYLLGRDYKIGQSEVAFSKQPQDIVYMSNVYGDFKLGEVIGTGPEKFMYLPSKNLGYLFDLSSDPAERNNLVAAQTSQEIQQRKQELLQWYFYQTAYIDQQFPVHPGDHQKTE